MEVVFIIRFGLGPKLYYVYEMINFPLLLRQFETQKVLYVYAYTYSNTVRSMRLYLNLPRPLYAGTKLFEIDT